MVSPPVPVAGDEHWAPDYIVLVRRVFTRAGRLFAERDATGAVLEYSPLAGMAAVEQRYPAWALGPFGRIEPEFAVPDSAGVFALVTDGVVRYVGASRRLDRTFGARRGLGYISRRTAQSDRHEESCRLNRQITAEAREGRAVDLYLLTIASGRRRDDESPTQIAAEIVAVNRGDWHLSA